MAITDTEIKRAKPEQKPYKHERFRRAALSDFAGGWQALALEVPL